ncbi:MAG: hypothetical protein J5604_06535 [Bacteroidales bacterium]|nr:hypothetical protein [Bacteroidales bacterium]
MAIKSKRCVGSEKEKDSTQYYYEMARKARAEALELANKYKLSPLTFEITNVIKMKIQVTKTDIRTIVGKNTSDDRFNWAKNETAKDIKAFLENAKYEGWADVLPGKHPESVYFVYYSKRKRRKLVLCVRKVKDLDVYKPYAIISHADFKSGKAKIKKGTPL